MAVETRTNRPLHPHPDARSLSSRLGLKEDAQIRLATGESSARDAPLSASSATLPHVRVGTWNLAGRWSPEHRDLMTQQECDVWLLTEVHPALDLEGYEGHRTVESIVGARSWAGIWSKYAILRLPDPHPATCLAVVDGTTFCSSILPWRSARSEHPWAGGNHAAKTQSTLSELVPRLAEHRPLVWGGDWNHSLEGSELAGSMAGRRQVQEALASLGLRAETAGLPHRLPGVRSIDHIAIDRRLQGKAWAVSAVSRERRLSDHDAFVLDFEER